MNNRRISLLFVLLAAIFLVTACSSGSSSSTTAPSGTTQDGAALLNERCTVCHTLSRAESSKHSAADWKTIVDSMISRGAQLTPEEETVVVNYLATKFGP
jgi:cytochrome c-type biogenesis protein CcmH/NrfF